MAVHRQTCGDDVNNGEPFEKLITRLIKPGIDYRGLSNSADRQLNRGRKKKVKSLLKSQKAHQAGAYLRFQ